MTDLLIHCRGYRKNPTAGNAGWRSTSQLRGKLRDKGCDKCMAQFLSCSSHAGNPTVWLVAQAVGEVLPDGDKEKQLVQDLLNQREGLEEAARQRELF